MGKNSMRNVVGVYFSNLFVQKILCTNLRAPNQGASTPDLGNQPREYQQLI